jgi:hypothetical protein
MALALPATTRRSDMWEKLLSADLVSHLIRIVTVVLGGLGTIYIPNKQFGIQMSNRARHIVATVSMLIYSMLITVIYHRAALLQMWWETFIFWLIANVVYVSVGYNLYKRIDHFLDKRVGKDTDTAEINVRPPGEDLGNVDDKTDEIEIKPNDTNGSEQGD